MYKHVHNSCNTQLKLRATHAWVNGCGCGFLVSWREKDVTILSPCHALISCSTLCLYKDKYYLTHHRLSPFPRVMLQMWAKQTSLSSQCTLRAVTVTHCAEVNCRLTSQEPRALFSRHCFGFGIVFRYAVTVEGLFCFTSITSDSRPRHMLTASLGQLSQIGIICPNLVRDPETQVKAELQWSQKDFKWKLFQTLVPSAFTLGSQA